jgi:hypothetical protein
MEELTSIVALAETSDMAKAGELLHIGPGVVIKRLCQFVLDDGGCRCLYGSSCLYPQEAK